MADISRLKSKAAVEGLIAKRYGGDAERFIAEINITINSLLSTDLRQAGRFLERIRRCFPYLPPAAGPRLLAMEARYDHWRGQSDLALRKYKKAIAQLQRYRNFDGAARARMGLMDVCMYLGRYPEGLEVGKKALDYFRRKADIRAAQVMTNVGNIYHRMDQNQLALRYYDRARKHFEKDSGVSLAIVDYNRANIFANLNQLETAKKLYRAAADVYRKHKMDLAAAKAEYSLAYIYFLEGSYTEALTTFEKVLDVFEKLADGRSAAVTRLDLMEINTQLSQFGSAIMLGQEVIPAFKRSGLRYEQAKASYFMGDALAQLGDNQEAAQYLNRADAWFLREGNRLWQGMVILARCRLSLADGEFNQALQQARDARRLFSQSGDLRRKTDADISLAEAYFRSDLSAEVVRLSRRLLSRPLVSNQKHAVLDLLGRHYLRHGQPNRALEYFDHAREVVEETLARLYPDEIRFFFALGRYSSYLGAAECLLKLGRTDESFKRHSHALALLNQRQIPEAVLRREVPQRLLDTRVSLRAALKKLERAPDAPFRAAQPVASHFDTEQQLWANERKIRTYLYPTKTAQASQMGLQDYAAYLQNGETLISYIAAEGNVGAFCVSSCRTVYIPCPVTHSELAAALRELHFLMENAVYAPTGGNTNRQAAMHYLRRLFGWLITPLASLTSEHRLIFLVDGMFAQIPFPALSHPSGAWLKDLFEIRVICDPEELRRPRSSLDIAATERCAVFTTSSAELPMAEQEGRQIKELYPDARLFSGNEATCDALSRELAQSDGFVHIAAHASRASENPLFSRILMSDGPFFPFDLFALGVKAELVTLSGCQTAAPGVYYGNSFSLAKTFYQGGARYVLAALWPLSDKLGATFMVEFYRALKEGKDIAGAYGTAMNETFRINDHPAFWGPFVLMGL